ncbi:MAG: hypothetical protein CVU87_04690 [Firmicutes bacterium HGW-Firmicutes-12]|nr:MAG: hypothetical protein CVU87_04690 [Firmicutes bacterium HGW-Firmicutes-12]
MSPGRIKLTLALIISEACYLYPLYMLAAIGLGVIPTISSWLFFILAILQTLINIKLTASAFRYIKIILINIILIIPASIYMLQTVSTTEMVLSLLLISWLLFRSIYLAVNRSLDIFLHFDLSITAILVILLIAGSFKIPLSTGITWLMISFIMNIVTISLNAGKGQGYLSWLGAVLSAVILFPMFFTARYFLPLLFEPAQFIYALGKPFAEGLKYIVGGFLSGYMSYLADRRTQSSNMTTDTNAVQITGGTAPVSPAVEMFLKAIAYLFIIIIAFATLLLFIYLLRLILVWIWRRQGKPLPHVLVRREKISWRSRLKDLFQLWDRLRTLLLPWLPVKLDIVKAYRALLKWGKYRRFPRSPDETPYEYLSRLQRQFPRNQEELHSLTFYYVQYKYGKDNTVAYSPRDLKNILRRLFYPRLSAR